MPSATWIISLVELVYYIPFSIVVLYLLYRNFGILHGVLGYIYLSSYMLLQIISSGMILSAGQNGTPSITALIIQSVGLVSLLLSTDSFFTVATYFTPQAIPAILSGHVRRLWHLTVVAAIAMGAYGASTYFSDLTTGQQPSSTSKTLFQVGFSLLAACWFILAVLVLQGIRFLSQARGLRPLLLACALSVVMLGVRVVYLVFCIADSDSKYGFGSTDTAIRVVFGFVPGAVCVLVLVVLGALALRGVDEVKKEKRVVREEQKGAIGMQRV